MASRVAPTRPSPGPSWRTEASSPRWRAPPAGARWGHARRVAVAHRSHARPRRPRSAAAVVAGGVLANITLLDAARPADVPVGSLAPLAASAPHAPPTRPAVPAPASPAPEARAEIRPTDDIGGADDDD